MIPGRDVSTLERQNYYFLIFKSKESAYVYQGRATKISKLSQILTPSSFASPTPPPPGYDFEGEDVHDLMKSYTLTPPSQTLSLRKLAAPVAPLVQLIIDRQGYPDVVNRPGKSPAEVLLRLEGPLLYKNDILYAIRKAQIEHNVPLEAGEAYPRISEFVPTMTNVSPMSRKEMNIKARNGSVIPSFDVEFGSDHTAASTDYISPSTIEEKLEEARMEHRAKARTPQPSYIVGFDSLQEADAFVSYWHQRAMEPKPGSKRHLDDRAPIVKAELLW